MDQYTRPDRPPIPELGRIFESVAIELPCCERQARVPVPPNISRRKHGLSVVTCLACRLDSYYAVTPEWRSEGVHVAPVLVT
ncbi:MAG: hypothetical protein M3O34_10285 [Chloroflexota bacterium]|nr:hypothetical protein [Chloroflexota bacterium]